MALFTPIKSYSSFRRVALAQWKDCTEATIQGALYLDVTETYPMNPNGSPLGVTGVTTTDGRFTAMMPHPERVYRTCQNSWHPVEWNEDSPWMRVFRNARVYVD